MLLDFFMPAKCAGCGETGAEICNACAASIATAGALVIGTRGDVPPVVALGPYEGRLRSAILSLKFRGARGVGAVLGRWIGDRIIWPFDTVVPVPLHVQRLRERGYNQAALIARGIASVSRRRFVPEALMRQRATAPQSGLGLSERRTNVSDAFGVSEKFRCDVGSAILVVDDVVTTGATVSECASVLRAAGARAVYVACAAIRL